MPRIDKKYEHAKDFKSSMKKLIISLKKWHAIIIISLILAFVSAIITLIAPDKLSTLTDYITVGLTPRINENTISDIMQDPAISFEDKQLFLEMTGNISEDADQELLLQKIDELPSSIYNKIKPVMPIEKIKTMALFLAMLYIISAVLVYIQQIIMAYVTNYYSKDQRKKITTKISTLIIMKRAMYYQELLMMLIQLVKA